MVHSCKAPEAQTATQQEHLAYQKEKDKKKKDKAKKWHGLSWRLVLNAALTNSQVPAELIPVLYQEVINSKMAAMADKKLHSQMVKLGHHDVGFAHGTAASLYNAAFSGMQETNQATCPFSHYTRTTPSARTKHPAT